MKDVEVPKFDAESLLSLAGIGQTDQRYPTRAAIFRQGDKADAVFYIRDGKVQISVVSEQGKEGVIALLENGDFIGEGCLAGQPFYMASASAMSETVVVRIEKDAMLRVLRERPTVSQWFMQFLLARNIQIEADLVDQLFNSSEKRLARVLLMLAQFGKDGKLEPVIPPVNQDMLAAKVGTTRSRINYFMNKFRRLGFIEYNGNLRVHSSLVNVIVHD